MRLAGQGITVLVSTHYMDEAERCHEIAYIAYGRLMARGSSSEIIAQSGLKAVVATGPGADRLAPLLRDAPGDHRRCGLRLRPFTSAVPMRPCSTAP